MDMNDAGMFCTVLLYLLQKHPQGLLHEKSTTDWQGKPTYLLLATLFQNH